MFENILVNWYVTMQYHEYVYVLRKRNKIRRQN